MDGLVSESDGVEWSGRGRGSGVDMGRGDGFRRVHTACAVSVFDFCADEVSFFKHLFVCSCWDGSSRTTL